MKLAAGLWAVGLVVACALVFVLGAAEEWAAGWNESRRERLRRRRAA